MYIIIITNMITNIQFRDKIFRDVSVLSQNDYFRE